jgi:hypothetical protein
MVFNVRVFRKQRIVMNVDGSGRGLHVGSPSIPRLLEGLREVFMTLVLVKLVADLRFELCTFQIRRRSVTRSSTISGASGL